MIPNTHSSVKHGGGNLTAWTCTATSGTGSSIFIDVVTHDGSSSMNSEVYRNIVPANSKTNASKLIGRSFIMQQDSDPKHTAKTTKEFMTGEMWKILDWPSQSPDLNPLEHAFHSTLHYHTTAHTLTCTILCSHKTMHIFTTIHTVCI